MVNRQTALSARLDLERCQGQKAKARRFVGIEPRSLSELRGRPERDEVIRLSQIEVCALPGAQMRGTWGNHLRYLFSLLPVPGPPACGLAGYDFGDAGPNVSRLAIRMPANSIRYLWRSLLVNLSAIDPYGIAPLGRKPVHSGREPRIRMSTKRRAFAGQLSVLPALETP